MITKRLELKNVPKGWGKELWIVNNNKYCGKILEFKAGSKFSMHFHVKKEETFYVLNGKLNLYYFDLTNGELKNMELIPGDIIDIPQFNPHRLEALEDSTIIEFSTHHEDEDSYRIGKGDSQK